MVDTLNVYTRHCMCLEHIILISYFNVRFLLQMFHHLFAFRHCDINCCSKVFEACQYAKKGKWNLTQIETNLLILPKGFTVSMKYFSLVTRTHLGFCTCSNIQVGYYLSSGGLTYGNLECFKRRQID